MCAFSNLRCQAQMTRSRSCLGYGKKCLCNQSDSTEDACYFETKACETLSKSNKCKESEEAKWVKYYQLKTYNIYFFKFQSKKESMGQMV